MTSADQPPTLFGHPPALYTLFFAEMWERFSYYGMRALLLFYMIKGFLGYGDGEAYAIYGAYTALVYMPPFFGGGESFRSRQRGALSDHEVRAGLDAVRQVRHFFPDDDVTGRLQCVAERDDILAVGIGDQ